MRGHALVLDVDCNVKACRGYRSCAQSALPFIGAVKKKNRLDSS